MFNNLLLPLLPPPPFLPLYPPPPAPLPPRSSSTSSSSSSFILLSLLFLLFPAQLTVRSVPSSKRWQEISARRMELIQLLIEEELHHTDYIFCLDVDSKFHGRWGSESLGGLVAVIHPGQYMYTSSQPSWSRRPLTTLSMPAATCRCQYDTWQIFTWFKYRANNIPKRPHHFSQQLQQLSATHIRFIFKMHKNTTTWRKWEKSGYKVSPVSLQPDLTWVFVQAWAEYLHEALSEDELS